jgi:D-alanyl-lipoteichoic acid acyltransferase DltB (MBOAT superfamily)
MTFNSLVFFAFFATVYVLYRALGHKAQNRMLLVASYVFYAAWDWRFLGLLFATTVVDFVVGRKLHSATGEVHRKRLLMVSLTMNLGLLGFFKYFNFFVGSLVDLLTQLGLHLDWRSLHIILPVGLSFYTFQSLSYAIDVYRRELEPADDFLDFALFVAFFPQLVAGPIERAKHLLPQVYAPRRLETQEQLRGCYLILVGLFKKIVIADGLASTVNEVFGETWHTSGSEVLIASCLFTLQIFGDFSGYSDVARGTAKVLGFDLMKNFKTPLFAASPSEYWTRWHVSLSSWVKDYVYFPMALAFMRRGTTKLNEIQPHFYSMALMGLWHGAAWTYVVWGFFHGAVLVVWSTLKWPKRYRHLRKRVPRAFWIAVYLQITIFSMMIFRADSLPQVGRFTKALLSDFGKWSGFLTTPNLPALIGLPLLLALEWMAYRNQSELFYQRWPRPMRASLYTTLLLLISLGASNAPAEFIYFQF